MFKSKVFYIIIIAVILVLGYLYKRYYAPRTVHNEVAYFMQLQHPSLLPGVNDTKNTEVLPKQLFGILILTSGIPNSQNMVNGILCIESSNNLEKVEIYMPDMGHGGEPPKVTPTNIPKEFVKYKKTVTNFGCFSIESMQLFMPGLWQIRPFYKDGTMGVFNVDLKN